jgi:hypothetical protein
MQIICFFKFLSELQIVLESDGEASLDVALFTCLHVLEFVGFRFVQWCHLNPSPFLNLFFCAMKANKCIF